MICEREHTHATDNHFWPQRSHVPFKNTSRIGSALLLVGLFATLCDAQILDITEDNFDGAWEIIARGNATGQRIDAGGHPDGAFWRAALSEGALPASCENGCSDPGVWLFVLRAQTYYDPETLGPVTRFDSSATPRFGSILNSSVCSVEHGMVVEQGGYLFGYGLYPFRNGAIPPDCWTGCYVEGCTAPGQNCGFGPIPPSSLSRVDGMPGGPMAFDATQDGAPFRVGFYMKLYHGGNCCGVPCCGTPIALQTDLDHWRMAVGVCSPPGISSQPNGVCAREGGSATFSIRTTGSPHWRRNGVPLTDQPGRVVGSESMVLTLSGLNAADAGTYDCVVTGSCSSPGVTARRISDAAALTLCTGDYNCDGGIDGGDIEGFFADWEAGGSAADVNNDGGIDGSDVETFFERWENGC